MEQSQAQVQREQGFQRDLQLSAQARSLLDSPLLQAFFAETEKSLIEQWLTTKPNALEQRETAYLMLTLTRKFKLYFESFLASESYARLQLEAMVNGEAA